MVDNLDENYTGFATEYVSEDVQANANEIRQRARFDYRLFIALLLGDELTSPTPEFHIAIFARMVSLEVAKSVFAVPRGFAKTTLVRLAVVYILLFTSIRNIFYFSHTLDLSVPSVVAIVKFMKSDNFRKVFGEITWLVEQEGKGIYKFVMPDGKVCNLRARGANQQVRGSNIDNTRIQLAICDDIEDREENNNPQIFKKLKQWFYSDMLKALDVKTGRVIQIGNIVSVNSLVAEHCESPKWFSMRYSAIRSDGSPLWPEMWPLDKLRDDYEEYANQGLTTEWFGEMMNIILPEGSQLISLSEIEFAEPALPGQLVAGFITIDPAISDNVLTAHKCSLAVHGFVNEKWQIVDHWSAIATDPIKLYDVALNYATKWGVSVIGIESEAYQASIKYVFEYIERRNEMASRLVVKQMPTGKRSKYARIASWVGYLRKHEYCLTKGDLTTTQQLLAYDSAKKTNDDDLIDAESYGVYMIERYLSEIMASSQHRLLTPQTTIIDYSPI